MIHVNYFGIVCCAKVYTTQLSCSIKSTLDNNYYVYV